MTFIHGYLLAGLLLVGVPILVHLIMKQKPKQLPFPAFRFLRQKHLINRRKLMLQHWLLMLLRMLLVAVVVLALTRPRLAGELFPRSFRAWLGAGADRPVAAVFVFDTSYRMDYHEQSQSRLDLAKLNALGLYREMAEGSRVTILDTGDEGADEDWMNSPSQVRGRLTNLRPRPVLAPLALQIDRARRLLQQEGKEENAPMPLLYVFSDRSRTSWDSAQLKDFRRDEDSTNPLTVAYVDLGVEKPEDVAIESIKVEPPFVPPGKPIQVSVAVRTTGRSYDQYVSCQLEGDLDPLPQRVPLKLEPGQSKVVTFNLSAPQRGAAQAKAPYQAFGQVTARLITRDNRPFVDNLAFNNAAFATFLIREDTRREGRKILTIAEDPEKAWIWEAMFKARRFKNPTKGFECDVHTLADAEKLTAKELERYRVVCLFEAIKPSAVLWGKLKAYVQGGGGLVIVPAGEELEGTSREDFNKAALGHQLLPAKLLSLVTQDHGVPLIDMDKSTHPLLLPFREWLRAADPDFAKKPPLVFRYWKVEPVEKDSVIVSYGNRSPALVEKALDRGRVVLFTVALGDRHFAKDKRWHTWNDFSSFGLVLVNELASYLAGDVNGEEINFWAGQLVTVPLPPETQPRASFKLDGPDPDLSDSERTVEAPKEMGEVPTMALPQALYPGNFRLLDRNDQRVAAFSLNVRPEESQLAQVPEKDIEAILGEGTVLRAGPDLKLAETIEGNKPAPIELVPLLMVLVLLALTVEGSLANRFYRREQPVGPELAPGAQS